MDSSKIQEGDLVLCIVDRIESNTVFVKLEDKKEATIIISEIAPGRIKNLREYVVPNKKIVCKVLRIQGDRIDLSLRRASSKEKKEFLESNAYDTSIRTAFTQILGKDSEDIIKKIIKELGSLKEFAEKVRENKEILKSYIPETQIESIEKSLNKKQREVEVRKIVKIKSLDPQGITKIKRIFLTEEKEIGILYLAAGTFKVKVIGEDYKRANQKLDLFIKELETRAKKENCEFEVLNE